MYQIVYRVPGEHVMVETESPAIAARVIVAADNDPRAELISVDYAHPEAE